MSILVVGCVVGVLLIAAFVVVRLRSNGQVGVGMILDRRGLRATAQSTAGAHIGKATSRAGAIIASDATGNAATIGEADAYGDVRTEVVPSEKKKN